MRCAVVAEDVVGGEAQLGEIGDRCLIPAGGVDEVAGVLGDRDLRGRDGIGGVGDRRLIRIDLEMNVRPATAVARRENRGESDFPALIGNLDPAQIILLGDPLRIQGVIPRSGRSAT